MKICIRADASVEIGTGHIMRCLALADYLKNKGNICKFFCRELTPSVQSKILNSGHHIHDLNSTSEILDGNENKLAHSHWLKTSQLADADEVKAELQKEKFDWVIADHYALDHIWESEIGKYCENLLIIDDLADRKHNCNILLDQNYGRVKSCYQQLVCDQTKILTGARYSILRPEFAEYRIKSIALKATNNKLNGLIISLGGVDRDNVTGRILSCISQINLPIEIEITIVLGAECPWIDVIRDQIASFKYKTNLLINVENMAELIAKNDLCIGAGGSSALERCCLGMPSLVIAIARNQFEIAKSLTDAGAARLLQLQSLASDMMVFFHSNMLMSELKTMSVRAAKVTDGCGVKRIYEQMTM